MTLCRQCQIIRKIARINVLSLLPKTRNFQSFCHQFKYSVVMKKCHLRHFCTEHRKALKSIQFKYKWRDILSSLETIMTIYYDTHRDGYGQNSYHDDSYCCPPVVDPLLFTALLAGIAGATQWLRPVIKMALGRRRKRSSPDYRLILIHGRVHNL